MKGSERGALRRGLSALTFWLGMGAIGILAIPAALFLGGISLIWWGVNAVDHLLERVFP